MNYNSIHENLGNFSFYKSKILDLKFVGFYKIKLLPVGKKKKRSFKIIVVNRNNRFVDIIGAFYPNKLYKINFLNNGKIMWLDANKLFFWLSLGIRVGPFMHTILKASGLLKGIF